jgi:hypothetical protein
VQQPAHPGARAELEAFLDVVWQARGSVLRDGMMGVYRRMVSVSSERVLSASPRVYLERLAAIAARRPEGTAYAQDNGRPTARILDDVDAGRAPRAAIDFFHFRAPGRALEAQERLYLNALPDRALDVLDHVLEAVLDDATLGVPLVKIVGPAALPERTDKIVIFCDDAAATARVVEKLRSYAAESGAFDDDTPAMTARMVPGIGMGAEPLARHGCESFGSLRAHALFEALDEAERTGGDRRAFGCLALRALRDVGVDPAQPAQNLGTEASP